MLGALTLLLVCQLVGEISARGIGMPVPGPVIGLLLLLLLLLAAGAVRGWGSEYLDRSEIGRVSNGLLGSLALLFVPAGVGLVQHPGVVRDHGMALAAALIGSALITLLATVGTFLLVKRSLARRAPLP